MSLTKAEIAALIKEMKSGGDSPNTPKYHSQVIYKLAELARNYFIRMAYNMARNEGTKHINGDFYSKYENVIVKDETSTDRVYFDLPAKLISLPKDRGLRAVTLMQDTSNHFNIVENGSDATFQGLEADDMGGPEVYLEGQKAYLRHADNLVGCGLLVRMISSIDKLDENEVIPIPSEFETDFIDKIVEMLNETKATPQDKHNDSNIDTNG